MMSVRFFSQTTGYEGHIVTPWEELCEVCDIPVSRTKLDFSFVTLFLNVFPAKQ